MRHDPCFALCMCSPSLSLMLTSRPLVWKHNMKALYNEMKIEIYLIFSNDSDSDEVCTLKTNACSRRE